MKKIICLLLSFTFILSFVSLNTLAAEELSLAVSPAYDSQNNLYYNVSAWYKFDDSKIGNSVVIEMVKKSKGFSSVLSDSDIYYIDEAIIKDDGTVNFDFKVKNYDEYTIRFTSGDFNISSLKKDVILLSKEGAGSLNELLTDVVNTADLNEMVNKINSNAYKLNLNTTYLNELTDPTVVAAVLKANKNNINAGNYSELFDRTVIFNYLNQQTDLEKIISMLEYYEGRYFKIASQQYLGIYPTYQAMNTDIKKKVISSLKNGTYPSFDSFRGKFNEAVILTALDNYDKTPLDKVFTDNLDYLGFLGYTNLSITDKSDILGKLIEDSSITTVDKLKTQYDFYKTGSVIVPILPPPPSNQGGVVGGGGASSTTTVDTSLANPENNQETVDLRTDFTDLATHEWAREAIEDLAYKKILSGKGNRQFFPGDNIKREEFIKILVLAFGLYDESATCSYTDIPTESWAYSYVASGTKAGLTVGYEDGSFGMGANITREDMAVMVHRLLVSIRQIDRITDLSKTFDDMDLVSGYAENSVKMLLNAGLVQGDNNKFNPKNNTTRAEAAQLIYNILKGEN